MMMGSCPSGPASNGTSSAFSGGAFPNIAGVYSAFDDRRLEIVSDRMVVLLGNILPEVLFRG